MPSKTDRKRKEAPAATGSVVWGALCIAIGLATIVISAIVLPIQAIVAAGCLVLGLGILMWVAQTTPSDWIPSIAIRNVVNITGAFGIIAGPLLLFWLFGIDPFTGPFDPAPQQQAPVLFVELRGPMETFDGAAPPLDITDRIRVHLVNRNLWLRDSGNRSQFYLADVPVIAAPGHTQRINVISDGVAVDTIYLFPPGEVGNYGPNAPPHFVNLNGTYTLRGGPIRVTRQPELPTPPQDQQIRIEFDE